MPRIYTSASMKYHIIIIDPDGLVTRTSRPSKAATNRYVETLPNVAADQIHIRQDSDGAIVGAKRIGVTRIVWEKKA